MGVKLSIHPLAIDTYMDAMLTEENSCRDFGFSRDISTPSRQPSWPPALFREPLRRSSGSIYPPNALFPAHAGAVSGILQKTTITHKATTAIIAPGAAAHPLLLTNR